ncbi:MAG: RDD family protein [Rickettsiales bacterium]|jgi:uncharacterized RDD family membrane protein YckC|nr:RDD family protein [Rickettsiales bacterium]
MSSKEKKPLYAIGLFGFYHKKPADPRYAGFNRRMLAATIDSVLALIILAPFVDYFMAQYALLPPLDWSVVKERITPGMSGAEVNQLMVQYVIDSGYAKQWFSNTMTQFTILALITGLCWRLWGATPGKKILRMKVVDAKTEALLTDWQVIARLFGYVISTLFFCIGFFWMGLDKRKQAWHDKLAHSIVIMVPKRAAEAVAASDSQAPSKAE